MVGYEDIIYEEVLHQNEAVNAVKYCHQMEKLHKYLQKKCPSLINHKGILLLHNNARPYIAWATQQKIVALNIEVLTYPPYSPDHALSD